jgi:mono/diheme cytochrome c family protein
MARRALAVLVSAGLAAATLAAAQPSTGPGPSRGELLYSTHCIGCHTAQVHWRDNKRAVDWTTLRAQVTRWQANAQLAWRDEDIVEVTRYLNERHYRFPRTGDLVGLAPGR